MVAFSDHSKFEYLIIKIYSQILCLTFVHETFQLRFIAKITRFVYAAIFVLKLLKITEIKISFPQFYVMQMDKNRPFSFTLFTSALYLGFEPRKKTAYLLFAKK